MLNPCRLMVLFVVGALLMITAPAHPSTLNSIGATVALKFFEGPCDDVPVGERTYSRTFEEQSTRLVAMELRLDHPAQGRAVEVPLTFRYVRPDGNGFFLSRSISIQPDSTSNRYCWGVVSSEIGNWMAGRYTVKVFEGEQEILSGEFTVYPELEAAETLFNWLETEFPEILSPSGHRTLSSQDIHFRYYNQTNAFIGTMSGHLYYLDHSGALYNVGRVNLWLAYKESWPSKPMPARTVPLTDGASLFFPNGSIPDSAVVSAVRTNVPALPAGLEAVGPAFNIKTANLSAPAGITLPRPSTSGDDPLAIVRVEDSGFVTVLETVALGDELHATVPGFSTVVSTIIKDENDVAPKIEGPAVVPVGAEMLFYESLYSDYHGIERTWRVFMPGVAPGGLPPRSNPAGQGVLVSVPKPGIAYVTLDMVNPLTGLKLFGSRSISVQALGPGDGMVVQILGGPLTATVGEPVNLSANALNAPDEPLQWFWKVGEVSGDCLGCGASISLPQQTFTQAGIVPVSVEVSDQQGGLANGSIQLKIISDEVRILGLKAPQSLFFTPGNDKVVAKFQAGAVGGPGPFWSFIWTLLPQGIRKITDETDPGLAEASFDLDQPGTYVVQLKVTNSGGGQTSSDERAVPFYVHTFNPVRVDFDVQGTSGPSGIQVGETVLAPISVSGGILIAGGVKGLYTVDVNWGDGTPIEQYVKPAFRPQTGVSFSLEHRYLAAGNFTANIRATDATGAISERSRTVTVSTSNGDPTPSGPFTIVSWQNFSGATGTGPEGSPISLSGSVPFPTFTWSASKVASLWVTAPQGAMLFGLMSTAFEEISGGSQWLPFAFKTIQYGDYSRGNTVQMPDALSPSPALAAGDTQYTVGVLTTDSATATVIFKVNP